MKKKEKQGNKKQIIEIQKETQIGDYILEAGDKVEVLKENIQQVQAIDSLIQTMNSYDFAYALVEKLTDMGLNLDGSVDHLIQTIKKRTSYR